MIAQVRDIACIRGGRTLFSGLRFAVAEGASLVVRGPNGIGKSSLLRMLAGLLPCAEGSIDHSDRVALADERCALDMHKNVRDALTFWARMEERIGALDAAMEAFDLGRLAGIPVRMLSTGQRKRATLARMMVSDARLWLLDEPGNGLDAASLAALGVAMDAHLTGGGAIIAASHMDLPHGFDQSIDLAGFTP